jgi:superfamily II DNA/RNA helicase
MKTPSRVITVNGRRANLNTMVSVLPPKNSIEPLLERIPDRVTCSEEIRKTVIFVDSVLTARSIARRLRNKLRKNLGDDLNPTTLVRTYYSSTDSRTKAKTLELFKNGDTRIVIATDAFSLGVNVKDIECAIQWGVTNKLTLAKIEQRIGRAARNPDMQGIGVVYAPKSLFFKFRKGLLTSTEKFSEQTQVDGDGAGDGEWEDIVDDIAKEITADEGIIIDNRDSDLSQFTLPVERATMKKVRELLGTMYKKATQMKDADNEQRAVQRGRFQGRNRRPVDSIDPGVLFFLNSDGCRACLRLAYFGYPDIFQDHLQKDWCCDSCGKVKGLDLETTSTSGIKLATSVHFYTEIKPTKKSSQLPAILLKPAQFNPVKPILMDLLNKWRIFRMSKLANSNPDIDPEMPLSFILPDPVIDAIAGSCNRQMSIEYLCTVLVKAGVSLTSGTLREKDLIEIETLMRYEVAKHLPASGSLNS